METTKIKKRINDFYLVLDIEDFNDIQEIIDINKEEKKRIFVLNKIMNARLLEHHIVLLKHQYFATIELYLFLFEEKMNTVDRKIYESMRTLKPASLS